MLVRIANILSKGYRIPFLMHLRLYLRLWRFYQSANGRCKHIVRVANGTVEFKDRVYKSHRGTHVLNGD